MNNWLGQKLFSVNIKKGGAQISTFGFLNLSVAVVKVHSTIPLFVPHVNTPMTFNLFYYNDDVIFELGLCGRDCLNGF